MIRGSITNPTEDEILKGKLPGNVNYGIQGPPGLKGSEGGYYIPDVTQMDENTIQFTFEPSKTDMPVVDPTTLELPAGSGIDVSGAAPGQTVKIAAVDDNGRPTSWEPADFPESGGNVDFQTNETLTLKDGVLSVNTTNDMEQDNTLPITSAGVFATVGNIEALLKTI